MDNQGKAWKLMAVQCFLNFREVRKGFIEDYEEKIDALISVRDWIEKKELRVDPDDEFQSQLFDQRLKELIQEDDWRIKRFKDGKGSNGH
jgi:hypothetical protein|tara:strand:- start:202 stop:471 length:270 start_codon:yes stop_codon:yes gene_type:complete